MKGTAGINDIAQNSEQRDRTLTRQTALLVSHDADARHQKVSFPGYSKLVMGNLKGKHPTDWEVNSDPGSRNSRNIDSADDIVKELTLENYKNPNISLCGSSSNEDDRQVNKCSWEEFRKLVEEARDAKVLENGDKIANIPLVKHSDNSHNLAIDHFLEKVQNSSFVSSRGPHNEVLPAIGFQHFLLKSSLKGKGVSNWHPGSYGAPQIASVQSDIVEKSPKALKKVASSRSPNVDINKSLYGSVVDGIAVRDHLDGISLRCWLEPGRHKATAERFLVFKQVLELVDSSHSEGLALRNLWPSYFMIFPSNEVRYVGSFVPETQLKLNEVGRSETTNHQYCRRKRHLINEKAKFMPAKYKKLNKELKVGISPNGLGAPSGSNDKLTEGFDHDYLVKGLDFNFRESLHQNSDKEHSHFAQSTLSSNAQFDTMQLEQRWYASPEELNGGTCCFTSNVYSLGVFFFELFCCFGSSEEHAAAMLDLRQRILPSSFLSEKPKEAGFCLWLLHPEHCSRPKSRVVLQCELINDIQDTIFSVQPSTSFDKEDVEAEMLLHFLLSMREQKERKAEKLIKNVGCLTSDIAEVVKRRSPWIEHLSIGKEINSGEASNRLLYEEPLNAGTISTPSVSSKNEERLMRNINQLEKAYFSMRSNVTLSENTSTERTDNDVLRKHERWSLVRNEDNGNIGNCTTKEPDRLGSFFDGLCKYACYSKFEVRGTLRNGDILNAANIICSLSFDRDEEYIAAAGVAKKVKVFEYASLLDNNVDIHYPVVEMSSKSRLSCVCWNSYIKNYLASTDYEGTIQLWDASTGKGFIQYSEHQRRAWSVDFSRAEPTRFASGSDDSCVKLWSINEKNSTHTVRTGANVCCVQFSSHSSYLLAFGSADNSTYCYDLRKTRTPWCTLAGHGKAVSYVKFMDSKTIVSASTDNTIKLWDLNKSSSSGLSSNACSMTFRGHANEKNFVGLSVSNGYITCGSETNDVYAYYKSLPMPITSHKFGSFDPMSGQESSDDNGQFVSSVCWRQKSDVVVAASSSGCIKLLQMV